MLKCFILHEQHQTIIGKTYFNMQIQLKFNLILIATLISITRVFFHFNTAKVMFFANSLEIFLELRTYFFNPLIGLPFTLLPPISTFLN